jgi:hypothetical protein
MLLAFVTGVIILARTGRGGNICGSVRSPVGKGFQNNVRGQEETGECVGNEQKGNKAETEI